ncbi:amidohydrolase [Undibacterium sp. TC4M20W]|uniref:amidohydrolase n=1 Tax=Undibacterium sp. TC4M20W TaxID=3413052 RepID=UPI003BF03B78
MIAIADTLYLNGRFTTLDKQNPQANAVAIADGKFIAVGDATEVRRHMGAHTNVIDLKGRAAIPGLHDSHTHLIRAGLNYTMELRWDGVPSLADAMRMLKEQVARTPAPQWVRVVGGFTEHQFAEKRLPTLAEINAAAPDTPVFILHLYDRALLNGAALRAVGYTKDTPSPPGGEIERDKQGNPTGLLLAKPNAMILYATLAKGPKLDPDAQEISTRLFMRELNRLGITSVIDAGGGFQNYPDDYRIIEKLQKADELTVRIAYNLFTQRPKQEVEDFQTWSDLLPPLSGDAMYRHNGAGEMLIFSAADFEDFREPRPTPVDSMEDELERVVRLLVEKRWPFRLHATYDETISRALDTFEKVNRDIPFNNLHWFFDHAETISPQNIDRVRALGGGIAIQHRMAYQGEYFIERYGSEKAAHSPPVRRMLDAGIPVGGGTDATRVASYNPWVSLAWMITGRTVGGTNLYQSDNLLDRETALRLWTTGSAWFANADGRQGQIKAGQLADFIVPSADLFAIPEMDIASLVSHLTVVGGKVVHGDDVFSDLAPPMPRAANDWAPTNVFGGYWREPLVQKNKAGHLQKPVQHASCCAKPCQVHGHGHTSSWLNPVPVSDEKSFWGALGCGCWL